MKKLHPQLGKIGIVLTGGFLRGAFQGGVLKAFNEYNVIPTYIVGVSVGALNGAIYAAGRTDMLVKTYEDIAKKPRKYVYKWNFYMLLRAFFWSRSILVNTPLKRVIIEERVGLQELISSPIKVDIITTDFQTGSEVIFSNRNPEHHTPDILMNALLASSAVPIVFPPIDYNNHQLFDGGVIERTPVTLAIREGCDTVFVVLTESRNNIRNDRQFTNIYTIAKRVAQLVSWQTINKDLERGMRINRDIEAYERLKRDVLDEIRNVIGDTELQSRVGNAISGVMEKKNLSFQNKRLVNIVVIEPDVLDHNIPTSFLDHRSIPRYLDEGYTKALKILKDLNFIDQ